MDISRWINLPAFIVVSVFAIYATAMGMLIFSPMPMTESAGTLLTSMIGVLTGSVVTIVSFYFGSSKGSAGKDQVIQDLVNKEGK